MATRKQEAKLAQLTAKKQMIFERVNRLYNASRTISNFDSRSNESFLAQSETISEQYNKFEEIIEQINELQFEIDETAPDYSSLNSIEDLYSHIKYKRNLILASSETSEPKGGSRIKLPPIELPSFDGKTEHWPIFYEMFRSNVHLNTDLNDSQRVQYLVSKLTNDALKLTAGIVPTGDTYSVMWNSLVKRYQDKRSLGIHYLNNILDIKGCAGNVASLNTFVERYSASVAALKQLDIPDLLDFVLLHCGLRKVDAQTVQQFESRVSGEKLPTYTEFVAFMQDYVKVLQRSHANNSQTEPRAKSSLAHSRSKSFVSRSEPVSNGKCALCDSDGVEHRLFDCPRFKDISTPQARFEFIKNKRGCINCLSLSHSLAKCKSRSVCKICKKTHHSLLHFSEVKGESSLEQQVPATSSSVSLTTAAKTCLPNESTILLATAQLYAYYRDSRDKVIIRCLLDNGSQNNLITADCCKRLNLPIIKLRNSSLQGVGMTSKPIHGFVHLNIESRINSHTKYYIQALVVDCITDKLPARFIRLNDNNNMSYLNNLPLADPTWNVPGGIDIVLGAQLFPFIYLGDRVDSGTRAPPAILTSFGYVLMGDTDCYNSDITHITSSFTALADIELESNLQKFFELEEIPAQRFISPDELECENNFNSSVLFKDGRYFVDLPFARAPSELGSSRGVAHRRLLALERKFTLVPTLRENYNKTIADYITQGYLSEVPDSELTEEGYYIPHHAVIRPDKDSIRVVLDASAKTHSGLSLNDILHVGPNLQADLFLLLIDFRTLPVAMTADIKQMFLRIGVNEHHRKYLRILYRFNKNEPIRTFNFNRVPFGLKPSPYLAMRTLRNLACEHSDRFPEASKLVETQFYMDDYVNSVSDEQIAMRLSRDLIDLMKVGSFDLVKWATNSPALLEILPESHRLPVNFSGMDNDVHNFKILGLTWEPADDYFSLTTVAVDNKCTKRAILSLVARLFDVLGLVAPVVLYAKILIKELWLAKIGWDEVPPDSITNRFSAFTRDFPSLSSLKVPRHIGVFREAVVNIVAFCDASFSGYGCCIYLHITNPTGNITVRLLCAKSKVSPAKITTLARLELVAALLLSKLVRVVKDKLSARVPIAGVYAFSDSTIALSWIHSSPHRWSIFVSNRIAQIQENIPAACFNHVSGKENPSDCLSRGMLPSDLIEHSLWWNGPTWLHHPMSEWPLKFSPTQCETLPEFKSKIFLVETSNNEPRILDTLTDRVCSWNKLLRVFMYILKFTGRLHSHSSVENIKTAENFIIRLVQSVHFSNDLNLIKAGELPSKKLRSLSVFVDSFGILRIGGRLSKSDLPYEAKHPALLPKRDRVVDLIIDHYHNTYCHTGPGLLMSIIRQRFWILDGRTVIRSRCRKCNTCFRLNPKHPVPKMAELPGYRVRDAKAFVHTGVDFAGPLAYVPIRRRGQRSQKLYLCLFVCMVTKAMHIELVSDLTSEAFLSAFKRFISRRGPVSVMYSDNGTNFVGAKAQLDDIYSFLLNSTVQTDIKNELLKSRIEWKRIPPRAPHFGGIWESNIKSVKTHLFRVIGKQLLTYEELSTVLVQIEGLLNSRPLSVLSSDPHPEVLTPAHFLMSSPLTYLPSSELTEENINLTNRKRLLDQLVLSYWNKWRVEYLHTLQVRQKWCTPDRPIEIGTVVLLGQDNVPPLSWPLGIIEEVFPGSDGVIRVASIRTASGTYKRPVTKLYPLPTQ